MAKDYRWRELERLVEVIEAQAAPRGAAVKSPDRLPDLVTGQMREVDASIRFRAGTTEILITVECRRRNRKADAPWIEQLASKRQRIGAAKTIAVSSGGFSKPAVVSAKHYGIELRKLSEVQPQDIEDWFLPHGIVHLFRKGENLRCLVKLEGRNDYVELSDAMEPCFLHDLVHTPFPAAALLNFIEMKQPRRFWAVPLDGTITRLEFDLDATAPDLIPVPLGVALPEICQLRVRLDGRLFTVQYIKLSADISYEAVPFESEQGKHYLYDADDGTVAQHSRFTGEVFGLPVTFDHQSDRTGSTSATAKFPSGLKLRSTWFGVGGSALDDSSLVAKPAPVLKACALCDQQAGLELRSVLPDYLFPNSTGAPKEQLVCSACTERLDVWDDYGRKALDAFPDNLGNSKNSYVRRDDADYSLLRLWLLSLLWRMSVARNSPFHVELSDYADSVKALLSHGDPGRPVQCPVGCVVPRFDGRRMDFSLQPDLVEVSDGRLVRAVFRGILFMFSLKEAAKDDELDPFHIRPGLPWIVPVIDYENIDFLKHWVDGMLRDIKNTAGAHLSAPGSLPTTRQLRPRREKTDTEGSAQID